MSSRYACMSNDNNDGNAAAAAMNSAEAPLPTYEQVVGISDPPHVRLGFKNDVPLSTSSSTDQGHSSAVAADATNRNGEGARRPTATSAFTCKPNRTGTILIIMGMVLIPLCGLIVTLQMKDCATDYTQFQNSIDKINASYSDCIDDLTDAHGNLDSNEILIRDLRYQVEQLTKQRDTFKSMVSKAKGG